jgi:hypothetical protein
VAPANARCVDVALDRRQRRPLVARPEVENDELDPAVELIGEFRQAAGREAAALPTARLQAEALESAKRRRDLALLASVYPRLFSFTQRAELVHLTQDTLDPCLHEMWRAVLRDALVAEIGESTGEHAALATALSGLDGDHDRFMTYFDDLPGALAEAKRRVSS